MIYPLALLAGLPLLGIAAWRGWVLALVVGVGLLEAGLIGSIPYIFTRWRAPNRRASMSMRLALRDAVRNGHRTFPAMASILTTVFVACGLLITLSSSNEAGWNSRPHAGQRGQVFLSTVDKTDSVTRTRNLLQSAQQVVDAERSVTSSAIMNGMAWNSGPGGPETMVEAVNPTDKSLFPQASEALGLRAVPLGELLSVEKPVNPVGAPSFQTAIARQVPGASAQVIAPTMRSLVLPYVAALIAVVAAAATVALVVALSSSDMRPDLDTLDAIGAAPTMRRHVTTWQGVVLALNVIPTAVLSGLVVGVLAVITFVNSGIFPTLTTTLRPIVPWGALLGMLIGMPILCALVAIILTPRHQKRIRRIN